VARQSAVFGGARQQGKRSTTPLWLADQARHPPPRRTLPKAPSPLRSAGAVHTRSAPADTSLTFDYTAFVGAYELALV